MLFAAVQYNSNCTLRKGADFMYIQKKFVLCSAGLPICFPLFY